MQADVTDLARRLRTRDPAAMDDLVRQFIAPVHRLAAMIIGGAGGPADVEEAAAEAFARAWAQIDEYDPARTSLTNWLLMLTKYVALDARRQLMRQRFTPAGEAKVIPLSEGPEPVTTAGETPEDEAIRRDRSERLHEALGQLPEDDRTLLVRRYFLEEPIMEIAQDLGLSRTAIDSRLTRARQALKAILGRSEGVSDVG